MADWLKEELTLREDHTWRAKPGCKIFVADRGALRLDYPEDWVVIPGENSINFHDRQPPDDDIHMEVSIMRLPSIDWSGLPLRDLIPAAIQGDARDIRWRGEIQEGRNGDVEIAWLEVVSKSRAGLLERDINKERIKYIVEVQPEGAGATARVQQLREEWSPMGVQMRQWRAIAADGAEEMALGNEISRRLKAKGC